MQNNITKLLTQVTPRILDANSMDDGTVFVTYNTRTGPKQLETTLSNYELATAKGKKINGILDTVHSLC